MGSGRIETGTRRSSVNARSSAPAPVEPGPAQRARRPAHILVTPKVRAGTRVCHLTSVHPAYDTRIFEKECLSLVKAGYDVHLVAPAAQSSRHRGVSIAAVPPARGRLRRVTVTTTRVLWRALQLRAAVYHFHDPELIPVGLLLRALGKHVIYDVHEDVPADILDKHYLARGVRVALSRIVDIGERAAARFFTRILAATPAIARRFPPSRCALVQNFPAWAEIATPTGTAYSTRPGLPVVTYVGLLQEIRGIAEMVRAIETLAARTQVRFVLAGRFDTSSLETRTRAAPGWQYVDYRGVIPRAMVPQVLAEARVGLVLFHPTPNHIESQPNKLFDYMAAGLPVVASRFPLWCDIVAGSRCGLLVDPLDPMAIAAAIDWLLTHPAEAEAMGARGREAVRERFNWPREEAMLLDCYARLCGS